MIQTFYCNENNSDVLVFSIFQRSIIIHGMDCLGGGCALTLSACRGSNKKGLEINSKLLFCTSLSPCAVICTFLPPQKVSEVSPWPPTQHQILCVRLFGPCGGFLCHMSFGEYTYKKKFKIELLLLNII